MGGSFSVTGSRSSSFTSCSASAPPAGDQVTASARFRKLVKNSLPISTAWAQSVRRSSSIIAASDSTTASLRGAALDEDSGRPAIRSLAIFRTQWLSEPIDNTVDNLREAVWGFVTRHQHEKLEKHVRRGNLNGLPNFLDIFRTLNGLLITFNRRTVNGVPVIPHPFVTTGITRNLDLLMGTLDWEGEYARGFIDAINANFQGDRELVRERLSEEHVPQILRAAVEAMIEVRRQGRKLPGGDLWATRMLKRTSDWIDAKGLPQPSATDIQMAGTEYLATPLAA